MGVRLKFSIGKGKIARLGLWVWMIIWEVWTTGVREIRVNNAQKKKPAGTPACENASVSRYQSPLNEKGKPAEYLPTSQNSQE